MLNTGGRRKGVEFKREKTLLVIVVAVAGTYAAIVVLVLLLQAKAIFPATGNVYRTPEVYGWDYDDVRVVSAEGEQTHGWFIKAREPRGTVLFSHGNAGNIADRLESASLFLKLGLNVLVYDYGGYGLSTGRPSEERACADIRAMWDYLTGTRGTEPGEIVLFGRSLGGGMTADLATSVKPAAVILESTFTSIPDRAAEMFPWLPMRSLIRVEFDNAGKVPLITSPLLIVHSRDDSLIPFRHGQRLFELAREPKQFLEIRGEHNEGFVVSMETWLDGLDSFLTPLLGPDTDRETTVRGFHES